MTSIPVTGPRRYTRRRRGVISVPLPSRRRPRMLTASIRSLRDHATRPDLLEFLVAHDRDDPLTRRTALTLLADVIWEAPRRFGYAESAHYYAGLIDRASGEWLLPTWGDDGLMQTDGWDDIIRAQPPGSVVWVDGNIPEWTCYPAVHADVLAVLGHICDLPALDTWLQYAGHDAGILARPDPGIYVLQDRYDLTGNNGDETWREAQTGHRPEEFFGERYALARKMDAARLACHAELMARYGRCRTDRASDIAAHLPFLFETVRRFPGARVAELGTRTGQSTTALLAAANLAGGHVWSVDCGPVDVPPSWAGTGLWSFLAAGDLSPAAGEFIPDDLDVLFIDTSHHYGHTLAELCAHGPRVVPGGVILMHDTELTREQIGAYEGTLPPGGQHLPVAAALDTWCATAGQTWTERPGSYGLGVIEKG